MGTGAVEGRVGERGAEGGEEHVARGVEGRGEGARVTNGADEEARWGGHWGNRKMCCDGG